MCMCVYIQVPTCMCVHPQILHACLTHVGWKVQSSEGELVFYMLHKTVVGLHVTYSVTVRSDFSYGITFRGHHIDLKGCTALNDVSASVDSGIIYNRNTVHKINDTNVHVYTMSL